MSVLSWNCRGLAATATMSELRELCKFHQPAIIFLMETRAPKERIENLRRRLKFKFCFSVEPRGLAGGLGLLWNDTVEVQIFHFSPNFIHSAVLDKERGIDVDYTFVYGNPNFQQRRNLWDSIEEFQGSRSRAWCCIGDFNELLADYEKDGLRPVHQNRIDLFRAFLNSTGLMDFDLKGCKYTWMGNPRNGISTREKIDRVLANWEWRSFYPHATALALPMISSDHSPIVLHPWPKESSGGGF